MRIEENIKDYHRLENDFMISILDLVACYSEAKEKQRSFCRKARFQEVPRLRSEQKILSNINYTSQNKTNGVPSSSFRGKSDVKFSLSHTNPVAVI